MRAADPRSNGEVPEGPAYYSTVQSPLGLLGLAATERGVCRLDYVSSEEEFAELMERSGARRDTEKVEDAARQLEEYFAGQREEFETPLDLRDTSGFQRSVLLALQAIPYGEVVTYGDLACRVDRPGAARAVGNALATNPVSIIVPCHRVVKHDGSFGEYALRSLGSKGRDIKLALLDLECAVRSEEGGPVSSSAR